MFLGFLKNTAVMFTATLCFLMPYSQVIAHETENGSSQGKNDPASFKKWLVELRDEASGIGIRNEILSSALDGVKEIPKVIELDRKQPEFSLTFAQYMSRVVPNSRVQKGRKKLAENKVLLEEVGEKFGVQPRFIVALWGIETDFGRVTGGFKVIPALVTLAHDGRRSKYFRKELINALKILNGNHIKAKDMVGSWAGAMGQCQFMPSSFLNFAIDYNGDGRKDIWTTKADVFGSAANYLSRSGWKGDQTWGRAVRLPADFNAEMAGLKVIKPIAKWSELGVKKIDGTSLPTRDLKASIVYTEGLGSAAYIIYNNYRTILKWNRSTYFAVAVGTLADQIGGI
jgi:membrane-bound lytic murein transglycosylase B